MKQTLSIFAAAMLMVGCWGGGASCESCDCAAGCCASGTCETVDCNCACGKPE